MTADPATIPDPIRVGRFWLFPDGRTLPVVSGAEGDEGDGGDGNEGDQSDQDNSKQDDPAAMADALKKANAEAKKYRLEAKNHAAELEKLRNASLSDQEKAVAEAKAAGRTEALREAGSRIVEATIRAGATGRSVDVDALLEAVDPAKFLAEDGSVDTAALTAWLDKVAPATKPAPKVLAGPRGKAHDDKPSISDAIRALRNG